MVTFSVIFLQLIFNVSSYNNGVGQLPAMGWSTWCSVDNCGADLCYESEVTKIIDALHDSGLYKFGYNQVHLDDCWSACHRTEGWDEGQLMADELRFPSGIEYIIDYAHNKSVLFGIYTAVGITPCHSWDKDRPCPVPSSFGHITEDANTFATWNVDWVKVDRCATHIEQHLNYTQLGIDFSIALNKTGKHIWYDISGTYNGYSPYTTGSHVPDFVPNYANSWRASVDHHDYWNSSYTVITETAQLNNSGIYYCGMYNWAYLDFLLTGGQSCFVEGKLLPNSHCPGQTDIEYMSTYSVFAIVSSPLIIATDIRNMTQIMKKVLMNDEIIAINQHNDIRYNVIKDIQFIDCDNVISNACSIWIRQLTENSYAVLMLNAGSDNHTMNIQFEEIDADWNNSTVVLVRDLWKRKDIGNYMGSFSTNVTFHGVAFTKMTQQ